MPIGVSPSPSGQRMYAFLERLIQPGPSRSGFPWRQPQSFDGRRPINTLGVREQIIISRISYDKIATAIRGMRHHHS